MTVETRYRVAPMQAPIYRPLDGARPQDGKQMIVTARGERFILRPLRPEDSKAYLEFIGRMTMRDLRLRFGASSASSAELDRQACFEAGRHVGYLAVRADGPNAGEIVGEVRGYRYPNAPTLELGLIVRSDMQRRGLGRALMDRIIEYCRANRLELIALIRPENGPMLRLASRCGMQLERPEGGPFVVAHLPPAA